MSGKTAISGKGSAERKAEIKRVGSMELMGLLSGSYFPANEIPPWGGGGAESTGAEWLKALELMKSPETWNSLGEPGMLRGSAVLIQSEVDQRRESSSSVNVWSLGDRNAEELRLCVLGDCHLTQTYDRRRDRED